MVEAGAGAAEQADRAVENTGTALAGGEELMAEEMFNGFDHTRYKEEVEERWGKDGYARGDSWWRGMSPAGDI